MKKFIAFGLAAVLMSFVTVNVSNAEEVAKNSTSNKKIESTYRCNPEGVKDRAFCYSENQSVNGSEFRCDGKGNNRAKNARGCCQR